MQQPRRAQELSENRTNAAAASPSPKSPAQPSTLLLWLLLSFLFGYLSLSPSSSLSLPLSSLFLPHHHSKQGLLASSRVTSLSLSLSVSSHSKAIGFLIGFLSQWNSAKSLQFFCSTELQFVAAAIVAENGKETACLQTKINTFCRFFVIPFNAFCFFCCCFSFLGNQ